MGEQKIRSVVVHISDGANAQALADRVADYHAEIVERRLRQSDLTVQQKEEVIERILVILRTKNIM